MSSMLTAATVVLTLLLIAVAVVDWRTMRIPTPLNATIFVSGMLGSLLPIGRGLLSALSAAVVVGGFFWLVRELHKRITGRVGLGLGDVKFAGAGATWIDLTDVPLMLLIASAAGLLAVGARAAHAGAGSVSRPLAFGPFLALALWLVWLTGWMR